MKTPSALVRTWKRRVLRESPKILIVRHHRYQRDFNNVIVNWVREQYPDIFRLFSIHDLSHRIGALDDVALHHPWLQDPVQDWSQGAYARANALAAQCDARGVPIVNRVDRLLNAAKSEGSRRMAETGVRTPRTIRITDVEAFKQNLSGAKLPFFVREDWGHGKAIYRVDKHEDVFNVPFASLTRPVAIEFVDTADRGGLYRKYRYFAAGDYGVSHHLQISANWIVRGEERIKTDATRDEELTYISGPDPNHDALQRARRALELDFVAFDYSYDTDGRMIVWEANPFPFIHFSKKDLVYRNSAVHRTIAAIVKMYLETGSMPVPEQLAEPLY